VETSVFRKDPIDVKNLNTTTVEDDKFANSYSVHEQILRHFYM